MSSAIATPTAIKSPFIGAKNKQKEVLLNLGYTLEKENAVCDGYPFEDWWLDK